MKELMTLLASRRSVRRFRAEPPTREQIVRLIEAAVTAPSASNKQPWRFIVVTRRDLIDRMAAAVRDGVERAAKHIDAASSDAFRAYGDYFTRFEAAPVVIVPIWRPLTVLSNLVVDPPAADRATIERMERTSGLMGAAMALENLLLMAHDMGLGASGMTGPLIAEPRLSEILEVPASWEIAALVPVGVPDETPAATDRKPAEKVIIWMSQR